MDTLHYIGKVAKTHGVEGEVQIACESDFSELIENKEVLFLQYEGMALPFIINEIKWLNSGVFLVSFLDYNKVEEVKRFVSCKVLIAGDENDTIPVSFDERVFISYTLIDEKIGVLGVLEDVIFKQQNLFVVNRNDNELLVPVVSEFITGVNYDTKELFLDLPEGMLDEL